MLTLSLEVLIALFLAEVVLELKPGPSMVTYMSMAMDGRLRSMLSMWLGGFMAGWLLYFAFLGGLLAFAAQLGGIFLFIKLAAIGLFFYIGYSGLKQALRTKNQLAKPNQSLLDKEGRHKELFVAGFLLVVSNPYLAVFILTIIPSITGTFSYTIADIVVIRLLMAFGSLLMLSVFCAPILFARQKVSPKVIDHLKVISAVLMLLIGAYMLGDVVINAEDFLSLS